MKSVNKIVGDDVLDLVDDMLNGAPNNIVTWDIWDKIRIWECIDVCRQVWSVCDEFD